MSNCETLENQQIISLNDLPKIVSAKQATWSENLKKKKLFPLGSAVITDSGELKKVGIKYIIHAASGTMNFLEEEGNPSFDSVKNSVMNSVRLALQNKVNRLWIPLVGGAIFLDRIIEKTKETDKTIAKEKLIQNIIEGAIAAKEELDPNNELEINFIAKGSVDEKFFIEGLEKYKKDNPAKNLNKLNASEGDITKPDERKNQIDAIVNAANMEMTFGGGLSGIIGNATKQSDLINRKAKKIFKDFLKAQK